MQSAFYRPHAHVCSTGPYPGFKVWRSKNIFRETRFLFLLYV